MEQERKNPEKLLHKAQQEELRTKRGKLKIFLGSAPGVGKTYAMLHEALEERKAGLDVVVGIVETHGRAEVTSMLQDFEILPRQEVDYHGVKLKEFDLDAGLKRHPGLILMDEMAHTNAPLLRHAKRWQDIKELLERGINVYTTLNVQHIESLNDNVARIIHAPIKETVPDSMIEMADTLVLIDIPPEELLKRLQDGKVYFPEQAELAAENFFRKGNLIALRELALRITAEWVGAEVLLYRQDEGIKHVWPTKDKILVCVGPNPESLKLIRAAKRMAYGLQAKWIAVYIDTPQSPGLEKNREEAIRNLRFAEQLGAETRVLAGFEVVKEVIKFAQEQNVTQIMIFKQIRTRWLSWFRSSLADEILRQSGEIDVYIMTGQTNEVKPRLKPSLKAPIPWKTYLIAIGIITLATFVNLFLHPYFADSNLILVYLLGVTMVALFGQVGPSVFASLLSVAGYDYFFLPPTSGYHIMHTQYFFTLFVMLLVAQVISHLAIVKRRQLESSYQVQHQTTALYALSRQLASIRGIDKLLETGTRYLEENTDSVVLALVPKQNQLEIRGDHRGNQIIDVKEQGIAKWVYEMGQIAGFGTDTLSFSTALYIPLLASIGPVGVLRIQPNQQQPFTHEQLQFIDICANQIALALEVDRLEDRVRKDEIQAAIDRVRKTMLQSVSYVQKQYLKSQDVRLHMKPSSIKEVISRATQASSKRLESFRFVVKSLDSCPEANFDSALIQEVIQNLIDSALKFTHSELPVEIDAKASDHTLIVSVERDILIAEEANKFLEKFHHKNMLSSEGELDLVLVLTQSIIEAHHGKVWFEQVNEGRVAFRFTLPLAQMDHH